MADKKLEFEVTAKDNASQTLEDVAEKAEQIEKLTPELEIAVDGSALDAAAAKAKTSIDGIGKSADSSKSVLANMVGNATQDLGALSGVAGSAGVAIGQMAEYMADAAAQGEGISSIAGNFAKVIGPVAAISLGVGLLSTVFGNMAKSAEEARKRAKEFADAVEGAGGNITATFAKLAESGHFDDLIDDLDRLGLSFEQFIDLASGGAIQIDPVRQDAVARLDKLTDLYQKGSVNGGKYATEVGKIAAEMGMGTDEALAYAKSLSEVTSGAEESGKAAEKAIENYARQRRVMQDNADAIDVVNEAVKRGIDVKDMDTAALVRLMGQQDLQAQQQVDLAAAIAAGNEQMAEMARVTREEAQAATDALADSIDRLNTKLDEQAGAVLSAAELRVQLADAQKTYLESLKDEDATVDQRVVNAQKVAEGYAAILEAQALANGESFTTTDRNAAIKASLEETAKQASGPTKKAIEDVVTALDKIPPSVESDLIVNNADALAKINAAIRQAQILRDELNMTRYIAANPGRPVGIPGVSSMAAAPANLNVTVHAGFGTDVFAVQSAVMSASRKAARQSRGAVRNG